MNQNSIIVLIVVSDGINNGAETNANLVVLVVLQLERFNSILHIVGSAGFAVSNNVDDPALAEIMTNWDLVVIVCGLMR